MMKKIFYFTSLLGYLIWGLTSSFNYNCFRSRKLNSFSHQFDSEEEVSEKINLWRLFNIEVPLDKDPGKDNYIVHDALVESVLSSIGWKDRDSFTEGSVLKIARKSFDGRWKKSGQPRFVYTVDLELNKALSKKLKIKPIQGKFELIKSNTSTSIPFVTDNFPTYSSLSSLPKVLIIGAGPAGLFAAIELVEAGFKPIIIERGKAVEQRGKSIGALFNRGILDPDSNLCYGEGGAGTWSDGKLTTRIGKNSDEVRKVLSVLVRHGAPERILVDGKPHLGTDRLVRILRDLRAYLVEKGAEFKFDSKVEDFEFDTLSKSGTKRVSGVILSDESSISADCIILAVGHSARQLYERLHYHGAPMIAKPFAAGFRIEHPQDLINKIQFGAFGELCGRGGGPVPVADYRLAAEIENKEKKNIEQKIRACYSFCMCPGGQIVPTSVNPLELCVNGMSFSKRQSQWANSALVVTINPSDTVSNFKSNTNEYNNVLDGVYWQKEIEMKAAVMGGGNLVAPVERVTDFLAGKLGSSASKKASTSEITSSYRLGIKESHCHELYPDFVTNTIREALIKFDKKMPGFITPDAILHGVETRTSSPVQITRDKEFCETPGMGGLFPAGEGAGHAGGIVSAAVDGMRVARAIVKKIGLQAPPELENVKSTSISHD